MVELKSGPPVWCPKQGLQGTGKVDKHVAHQEEPKREEEEIKKGLSNSKPTQNWPISI